MVQSFELCNLSRIEERFDLLSCGRTEGLMLFMFLLFGQARVLMYCLELRISGNQNRPNLPLLGFAEAQFGRQPCELLFGAEVMMMMPLIWCGTGRLVCVRRRLGQSETGKKREGNN